MFPGKFGEFAVIALVRRAQGVQVRRPNIPFRDSVDPAPRETWPPQNLLQQQVGEESRMAAVPVREGMNQHQPVVKSAGDLVRWIKMRAQSAPWCPRTGCATRHLYFPSLPRCSCRWCETTPPTSTPGRTCADAAC